MSIPTELSNALGEAFRKKTTSFLFLGILLLIASMYINVLKESAGDTGIFYSGIIIIIAVTFQVILWLIFLIKKFNEFFN